MKEKYPGEKNDIDIIGCTILALTIMSFLILRNI